jgi:transposase-like protein
MSERAQYDAVEEAAIRAAVREGGAPRCPRCAVDMVRTNIGGGSFGLGYSRKREWLRCPQCRRSVIFDFGRGTRT